MKQNQTVGHSTNTWPIILKNVKVKRRKTLVWTGGKEFTNELKSYILIVRVFCNYNSCSQFLEGQSIC